MCGGCLCPRRRRRGWAAGRASGPSGGCWTLGGAGAAVVGARGRVRVGAPRGSRRRGLPSPLAACGPHPSPVVHCCFRGGGPAATLRGRGPAAPTPSCAAAAFASRSPAGGRAGGRAALWAATAGVLVMNGAGRAPRRPLVTAAEEVGFLGGARSAVPLWWRKVDATWGLAAEKPRCQVASERPLAPSGSLGAAAPPLRRS